MMHISTKQQGQPPVAAPAGIRNFVFFGHFVGEVISSPFLISKLDTEDWVRQL